MSTVHQPDHTRPPEHRWNANRLDGGGDTDAGTGWSVHEIDADSRPQAELRMITVAVYDYEDDFRAAVFTAHPDPAGTPNRYRVLIQIAPPGGRDRPQPMEPEARHALYDITGPGPIDVLDAPTVHPHIHLRIIDTAAHAQNLYGAHELAALDEQARQVLLRDNKTSDDAKYDDVELARMLADLPQLVRGEPIPKHEYVFEVAGAGLGRITFPWAATAADIVRAVQHTIDLRKKQL